MGKAKKAKVKKTGLLSSFSHPFPYHLFFKKSQSPKNFCPKNFGLF